jgi:hypothetical protein
MKNIFTILLLLVSLGLAAQNYNNEWIDYSKTYYKFKVGATGLYRISQPVLASAGMGGVPAQNFQLFRNGKEVPIYTSVASGPLGGGDYIEFWGLMNDGVPDAPLYRSPAYQHTQKWSLETDTAVYFLTVDPTGNAFHFVNTANNVTGTTLSPEPYFLYKAGGYFKNSINPGFAQIVGEYIYSSSYDMGEFWSSGFIQPGNPLVSNLNNLFVYNGGPDASIRFGLTGCADNPRPVQLRVNNTVVGDTVMNSFSDLLTNRPVPLSLITSNSAAVQYNNNSAIPQDRMVASFYELTYPRQFNFGGQSNFFFDLPAKSDGYLLNITNFNVSGSATPVLYDLSNGLRYTAIVGSGNVLSFLLGGSGAARHLVLVNEDPSTVIPVLALTSKSFVNFATSANQGNYLIISNPLLYTGTSGNNPVVDYKNYRSSAAGGSFDAQIYDINELVDQFGFGIKKDPLAIQNFLRYARAVFVSKPQFVLLIGHGMTYSDYFNYSEINHDPLADRLNLVPTYGYPASDNKLSANNPVDAVPVTPIGRLSVVSGAEIEIFLTKLKEYEQAQQSAPNTIDGRLWMKNVLHVTGASEPYLGTILCNYMYSYQQIIADTLVGSNVYTLCDGNASQISQVPSGFITSLFNNGFGMLNYFGHSTNTALGYDLDNPGVYSNAGKYPVFYLNGCDAGDFFVYDQYRFATGKTLSESYVLAQERGAMAVVASTHFGIVTYLNILLYWMYQLMDGADYGKPMGIIEKDALQHLINAAPGDYFGRTHAEQMTTHGDPYLKLNQQSKPDYDVEASQVVINPNFVSVANNFFSVNARFYNLGKAIADSITVLIARKYPDGSSTVLLRKRIRGIAYSDSVQLSVPIVANRDKGQNYITVTINSDNDVSEITTNNNSVVTSVYIYEDGATPIYPYNYALINTSTQKLYASTSDPFFPSAQYVMEIDTTTLFNSPGMVSKFVTTVGGEMEFDPGISYRDSVVYYWRVAMVPPSGGVYTWNGYSFVYINPARSVTGANQSHFYQHTQSVLQGLELDSASRRYIFQPTDNILSIKSGVFPDAANQAQDFSVLFNGNSSYIQSACGVSKFVVNVIDPITFKPWFNNALGAPGQYGSLTNGCGGPGRSYDFLYDLLDPTSRASALKLLDTIPDGFYVVVWNFSDHNFGSNTYANDWKGDTSFLGHGNSLYNRLSDQGFSNIDSFNQPRAFIFLYEKNRPANFAPRSVVSQGISDKIALLAHLTIPDSVGTIVSPPFGPAKKWRELHWRGGSLESPTVDSTILQLVGIDTLGNASPPMYVMGIQNQDIDISSINAKQYPFVQLKMTLRDTVKGTPYQLKYWRVTYDPAPEGALAPNVYLKVKDTLQLGEVQNFGIAFKNVSPIPFDSILIKLNIIDRNNVTHVIPIPRGKALVSGDTLSVNYQMDTKSYPGANTIFLDVNPNNNQPEQYHFNNFLYKTMYVNSETRNPQLDVTFDNIHILNDDIVSAKPHIQIKLTSQSQFILLTDTSSISVQLRYPDGTMHTYGFNNDTLRFIPASSSNNNAATVDFNPAFLTQYNPAGDEYQLIVSGKDALGNTAGATPYRVSFKIITKPMISNMLNYPNPFTTSTAFVFTITGSDVPQNIKIQILTITGKIVREITKEELGPLHVGRNITEFKWNGTDMYGARLANGVYLYHVVTNLDGKSLDKYKAAGDNTDKFFNNGYGKMYLMK